ncbi:UPF0753 protein [Bryobacterales bacterium F-183]|nr:UPF0753 protein [Bryobacterales bacterium F-183]
MAASMVLIGEEHQAMEQHIQEATKRIAPLWPLQNFVAVNPFLGLTEMPFTQAGRLIERNGHAAMLMDADFYREKLSSGAISAKHIRTVLEQQGQQVRIEDPVAWLQRNLREEPRTERMFTVAEWLDIRHGSTWARFIVDEVSKWCSSYYDAGQSAWSMPWRDLPLYAAWKRAAEVDRNPEAFGIPEFRQHVKQLPEGAEKAIEVALRELAVPEDLATDFLHRQLMSVIGWSAYAAFQDRQGFGKDTVQQILAIRLAYDTALLSLDSGWRNGIATTAATFTDAKYISHLAFEESFRSSLVKKLTSVAGPSPAKLPRPQLQAVFCIDVRSEVYRRALEAQQPGGIETLGFAGFFGMSLEVATSALCPVLISPAHRVGVHAKESQLEKIGKGLAEVWKNLSRSAATCFPAVEAGGALFGARLVQDFSSPTAPAPEEKEMEWSIPVSDRVDLAAGALKNMSLDVSRIAPVVLLCGHGATTANNPYGSSLDCGACGGHKGDINARFAAALFNDPEVRQGLAARGITIPQDTVFIGGLHNTTTDQVTLYDSAGLLPAAVRADVEQWLQAASKTARRERSGNTTGTDEAIEKEALKRSRDYSEVRPEWGLAGNAAFIAAPRWRTRDLNLQGRVFLHEYEPGADTDGSVLNLILNAPVVVASWINLQYFGSTVDNEVFGSGNKVLHNVAGTFGVWEGNAGDLRTGLPLQSLHDGTKWVHEPVRLQVLVDAPRERIESVLAASPNVRALFENDWIHLMVIEGQTISSYRGGSQGWQPVQQ